jgi:hypothetical protein
MPSKAQVEFHQLVNPMIQLPKKQWTELNAVAHPKQPAIHPDLLALNVTATTFTIQHSKAIQSSN